MLNRKLDTIFAKALDEAVFSAGAVAVSRSDTFGIDYLISNCYGFTESLDKTYRVTSSTFFDLASLTKPLVTVASLLTLLGNGQLHLDDRLADLLHEGNVEVPGDKRGIRLWQLMAHCSGLPAYRAYYPALLAIDSSRRKLSLLRNILCESLEYTPGSRHVYSDLGFMLLGIIVEIATCKALDAYYREAILLPLHLESQLVFPRPGMLGMAACAATEVCPWTHKLLSGVVHDDNCRALGGVAGHAGLFGTAEGVLGLCTHLCRVWQAVERNSPFSTPLVRRIMARIPRSTWSCGFDTPSRLYSSSGHYFQEESVGHLGFTGTSFWIDLRRGISIVLLTNRVHPRRDDQRIKRFRPKVHDLIMRNLLGTTAGGEEEV